MRVTYWKGIYPEDVYESTLKNIKSVDFYNGYVRCYTNKHEEIEISVYDLIIIEED